MSSKRVVATKKQGVNDARAVIPSDSSGEMKTRMLLLMKFPFQASQRQLLRQFWNLMWRTGPCPWLLQYWKRLAPRTLWFQRFRFWWWYDYDDIEEVARPANFSTSASSDVSISGDTSTVTVVNEGIQRADLKAFAGRFQQPKTSKLARERKQKTPKSNRRKTNVTPSNLVLVNYDADLRSLARTALSSLQPSVCGATTAKNRSPLTRVYITGMDMFQGPQYQNLRAQLIQELNQVQSICSPCRGV